MQSVANILRNLLCFRLNEARLCYAVGAALMVLMAAMLVVTPRLFDVLENDSSGYIEFSAIRSATYPLILRGFDFAGLGHQAVIYFQCSIFVLSYGVGIGMLLRAGLPLIIVMGFALGLTFNIYFNAFHFSILTESLSFSLILILAGLSALVLKQPTVLRTSAIFPLLGVLFTLKPAALPLVLGLLISIGVLCWQKKQPDPAKTICIGLILLLAPVGLENLTYSFYHKERASLLPVHLYGKSAIITALSSGVVPPTVARAGLSDQWMAYNHDVNHYLTSIEGQEAFCLKLERVGDYEDHAYWHLGYETLPRHGRLSGQIFLETLSQNPFGLIQLVAIHRANFLCVSTPITNAKIEARKPLLAASAFGPEARYSVVYYAFLIFGFVHITAIIYYLYRVASCLIGRGHRLSDQDHLAAHLLLWAEGYLWFVAIFSITNPRYLMLVFPIMLLMAGLFLQQRIIQFLEPCHSIAHRDDTMPGH